MPSPAALYQVGIVYSLTNRMSAALGAITRDMRTAQGQAALTGAEMNRLKASMIWDGAALIGAGAIVGVMKGLYESGQRVIDAETQLGAIVQDNTKRQQAYNAAWEATRKVQGTTWDENIKLVRDLTVATGSLQDALKLTPQFAMLQSALRATNPAIQAAFGERGMFDLAKALELRGALTPERIQREADLAFKAIAGTGGRVGHSDFFAFMKTSNVAGRALSDQMMYQIMPSIIQEMGAPRAGTALMSLFQNILGGIMSNRTAQQWMQMGMLDPHKVQFTITGRIKQVMPRAVIGNELFTSDPYRWTQEVLLPHMRKSFALAHGGRTPTTNEIHAMIFEIMGAQRRTSAQLLDIMLTQQGRIEKDARLIQDAQNVTAAYKTTLSTKAWDNFMKSLENLKQVLGKDLVTDLAPALQRLTKLFTGLADAMEKHPAARKFTLQGMGGAAAYLGFEGILALAGGILKMIPGFELFGTAFLRLAYILSPANLFGLRSLITIAQGLSLAMGGGALGLTLAVSGLVLAFGAAYVAIMNWSDIVNWFTRLFGDFAGKPRPDPTGHPLKPISDQQKKWLHESTPVIPKSLKDYVHVEPLFHGTEKMNPNKMGPTGPLPHLVAPKQSSVVLNINAGAIAIHQQPGEDHKKLAERVLDTLADGVQKAMFGTTTGVSITTSPNFHGVT